VLEVNPVILLVNDPVPVPSDVLLLAVVGFCDTAQHTPLAVTSAPPSLLTVPPDTALVCVIPETFVVLTSGISGFFLQEFKTRPDKIIITIIKSMLTNRFMLIWF
jgi:hypothetical protein